MGYVFILCYFFLSKVTKRQAKIFAARLTENYDFYAPLKSCFLVSPLLSSIFGGPAHALGCLRRFILHIVITLPD